MNDKDMMDALNRLDRLFIQADKTNSSESWGDYLDAQKKFREETTKWNIQIPRNHPNALGVKWGDALEGAPTSVTTIVLQRWRKSLHRADAPRQMIIDRYIELTNILHELTS